MELGTNICHQCGLDIADSFDFHQIDICNHCGWIQNHSHQIAEKSIAKRSLLGLAGAVLALSLVVAHTAKWGNFFFAAIPLNIKTFTGLAVEGDYSRLAVMCEELKNYQCVEDMLKIRAEVAPGNVEALADLGLIQYQRRNFVGAHDTLSQYVALGGLDLYANYIYAKTLSEIGQIDKASLQYKKLIAAKPNTLQITVTQSYVHMLMKNGRESQAKAVIQAIRSKGSNAADFMKNEMRQLASTSGKI